MASSMRTIPQNDYQEENGKAYGLDSFSRAGAQSTSFHGVHYQWDLVVHAL